jgi:hypothetical protein
MNFQGFSPDSFEQFIRALTVKILGPGVTLFGNGPDGGREAEFQGKVPFPHPPKTSWEGYGIVQAKFKEKEEGTSKDQKWAEKQLESELSKWENGGSRESLPQYYIFCTNVFLSSGKNGGRSRLDNVFKLFQKSLKLKDYRIWDANQLLVYVDTHEEVRKRFTAFLTPGDVLASLCKVLERNLPRPDTILAEFLFRDLLADEDARLSQAGDRSEDRVRLANVFTDLPSSAEPIIELQGSEHIEDKTPDKLPPASLHILLRAASRKLDPLALAEQTGARNAKWGVEPPCYGRFVFIGGPGSGKSTIGQFLAQIHRAALLSRRPAHKNEAPAKAIIADIKNRAKEEEAPWPTTPRYPFRVELNSFAKALASKAADGVKTLSQYLRRSISQNVELQHQDLIEWLRTYPWLLILDGLDEVPSSSNRREVVGAIQAFLSEARNAEADLMVVATSRPDGYAGEFNGDEVSLRYLEPLSRARAIACAQRYVSAKSRSKSDQRAVGAMSILRSSIQTPLVAKLMSSPLQVTFMVTVVFASGKPSDSRWQLFKDYYRTIYERELHKAVPPFAQVLSERRQDIDALHHRIGFILQCRAESSGGTQADMPIEEFDLAVTDCLKENGLAEEEIEAQRKLITDAAKQRLGRVFKIKKIELGEGKKRQKRQPRCFIVPVGINCRTCLGGG